MTSTGSPSLDGMILNGRLVSETERSVAMPFCILFYLWSIMSLDSMGHNAHVSEIEKLAAMPNCAWNKFDIEIH